MFIKRKSFLFISILAGTALIASSLFLVKRSWSTPGTPYVTSPAPEHLSAQPGSQILLSGGGFSSATSLWLAPERSIRSATNVTLETFGSPQHFVRRDDRLYVASGIGGFLIIGDVESEKPRIEGVLNSEGQAFEVALRRNEALLAAGKSGLQVIDIRDPATPKMLAILKSVAPALSIAQSEDFAYIAAGRSGVWIVDLSDPHNPQVAARLADQSEGYKVFCEDRLLFISTADSGYIYDVSRPQDPRRLAKLPLSGGINTVISKIGEILYWGTRTDGEGHLYAIDLHVPTRPRIVTNLPFYGTPVGLSHNGDQLNLTMAGSGTGIYSTAAPRHLELLHTIPAKSGSRYALSAGDNLWVADGGGDILRINKEKSIRLAVPPLLPGQRLQTAPIVTSQLLLLANREQLSIYDRGDDKNPILIATLPVKDITQLYLSNDQRFLWLATGDFSTQNILNPTPGKLFCVDLSDPYSPRVIKEFPMSIRPFIIGESSKTLIAATVQTGTKRPNQPQNSLELIDISIPQQPALLNSITIPKLTPGISIDGHSLYYIEDDGQFRAFDLTDRQAFKETASLQLSWLHKSSWTGAVKIIVKDQVAYIASPLGKVTLIDLHNPRQLKNLGVMITPGEITSVINVDHFLMIMTKIKGMMVIDVANSLSPAILGTIPLPGIYSYFSSDGATLWYANSSAYGLWSLPLPRRLLNLETANDHLTAKVTHQPQPGPYRLWLTDGSSYSTVPGVTWIDSN